jgi:hypothetical protein
MGAGKSTKLDLYKEHKEEYKATRTPAIVRVGPAKYIEVDGQGKPGGPEFEQAVGFLYATAYTLKFNSKAAGRDFKVASLEGFWEVEDDAGPVDPVKIAKLPWTLAIRVPDFISKTELGAAARQLLDKGKADIRGRVALRTLREGTCVQALHVGPYADEPATFQAMRAVALQEGFKPQGHHEIYLSDPRRVAPARLRTILRQSLKKAR